MGKNELKSKLFEDLAHLYTTMEAAYSRAADTFGLSCEGCSDNCCTSYFQHHTYIEWAYLWEGINACSEERRRGFLDRAKAYVAQSRLCLAQGKTPGMMCPLNENGLCRLYEHRLMICRMHGVPNSFIRPDGKVMRFPGCIRCQEQYADLDQAPMLDRTPFYKALASLEMALMAFQGYAMPKVKLTLAEMLVQGPPQIKGIGIAPAL
jgi:Fe-S-cluster containining protein